MTANSSNSWRRLPMMIAKLALVEQASVPMVMTDAEGMIGYVNDKLCSLFGFEAGHPVGKGLDTLARGLDLSYWQRHWWPLLLRQREIREFPTLWSHCQGLVLDYAATVRVIEVSGIELAAFYLLPKTDCKTLKAGDLATGFLENLGESVGILDSTNHLQYANRALRRMLAADGFNPLGRSLLELIVPDDDCFDQVWNALNQDDSPVEFEFHNLRGDRLAVRMSIHIQCEDHAEEVIHKIVSFADITEQRRIAQELAFRNASLERLASNIPGFIYTFRMTPEGHFSFPYASRGVKEVFGVEPEEVKDDATPIINTIHPDDVGIFEETVLHSAATLTPWNFEARLTTSGGGWKWFHGASRPQLMENGEILWEGVVMDVTDRKQAEEELRQAKEMAEAAARSRAEFLAIMSHEIRTPLNAIVGFVRWVLETELSDVQRESLIKVRDASDTLLGVINNILDFTKLESGKMNAERIEFNLDTVLQKITTILLGKANEKNLEFIVDCAANVPPRLIGDPLRLEQILINLGNNAIKFTADGYVLIGVEVMAETRDSVQLCFRVVDTGIGLSEDQQNKIFDAFRQADTFTTRKYGGTGLGLSICRHIVEMMEGEIGVQSQPGLGSEFHFTLHFGCQEDPSQQRIELGSAFNGTKVWLIDASEANRRAVGNVLKSLGCEVEGFASTVEALRTIDRCLDSSSEQPPCDLLLLDGEQGEMENTIAALESRELCSGIPLVLMQTAPIPLKDLSDYGSEVIGILSKPVSRCHMARILGQVLGIEPSDLAAQDEGCRSHGKELFHGMSVLLVEDNAVNREIACKILHSMDVRVEMVDDGQKAVQYLLGLSEDQLPDAVLMDLQMPEMDGFEATRQIRTQSRLNGLPVIAMTAHAFEEEKQKCLAVGMDAHVSKPIDPVQLQEALKKVVSLPHQPGLAKKDKSVVGKQGDDGQNILGQLTTVDVARALERLNNDANLLIRLLLDFAAEYRDGTSFLTAAIQDDRYEIAVEHIHKLKGVSGNLSVTDVYEVAVLIERALNDRLDPFPQTLLKRLETCLARYIEEVHMLPDSDTIQTLHPDTVETGVDDSAEPKILLNRLIGYLESNNLAAEQCLDALKIQLDPEFCRDLQNLSDLIAKLDFNAALSIAEGLCQRYSIQ